MQGRHEHDVIGEDAMALDGRQVIVSFYSQPVFLEGEEVNDEACGCVYYVVLDADRATDTLVTHLRSEIGLDPLPEARSHLTIAGVAPASGNSLPALAKLRAEWCAPRVLTTGYLLHCRHCGGRWSSNDARLCEAVAIVCD